MSVNLMPYKSTCEMNELCLFGSSFCQGRNVLVNLIPYNPTYAPGSEEFQEPTEEALQRFRSIVHEHGLLVTIRR